MKRMAGTGFLVLLLAAWPAAATTARYDYAGIVEYCDDTAIGGGVCGILISPGDAISGWVDLDSSAGLADRLFTAIDVLDYLVGIEGSPLGGATPDTSELDPASTLVSDSMGLLVAGELSILVDPALLPVAINADIAAGTWEILLFPGALDLLLVSGSGSFGAPVPLPGAVWLLGSALLLGARAARRSAG